jgi:hypothetical protein
MIMMHLLFAKKRLRLLHGYRLHSRTHDGLRATNVTGNKDSVY